MMTTKHYSEESPIKIKFIPKKDQPAHFYFGDQKFTPDQYGNNCLIHAILTGIGCPEMDAHEVRKEIAKACMTEGHPSHDYIKRGITQNYVKIGLIGGGGEPQDLTFRVNGIEYKFERADWDKRFIDEWLYKDWKKIASQHSKFKVRLREDNKLKHLENLSGVADDGSVLHRCHHLSQKSLNTMLVNAVLSDHKENREQQAPYTSVRGQHVELMAVAVFLMSSVWTHIVIITT